MRKRIEVSFYKNHFRTSGRRGTKPFQISCEKGKEYHFEFCAEEKRSYRVIKNSKPRAEEGQNINSSRIPNLVQKKEVTRSPKTLGLVRKRIKVVIHQKIRTSCWRGKEYLLNYLESRVKENSNYKVHQKILNLARNRDRISGIIIMIHLEWVG